MKASEILGLFSLSSPCHDAELYCYFDEKRKPVFRCEKCKQEYEIRFVFDPKTPVNTRFVNKN